MSVEEAQAALITAAEIHLNAKRRYQWLADATNLAAIDLDDAKRAYAAALDALEDAVLESVKTPQLDLSETASTTHEMNDPYTRTAS